MTQSEEMTAPGQSRSAAVRVLIELARVHGMAFAAGLVERRLQQCRTTASPSEGLVELLQRAASDLDMRATVVEATLEDVVADVDSGRPASLVHEGEDGARILVLRRASGGRLERAWVRASNGGGNGDERDGEYEQISLGRLRDELDADEDTRLTWLLVDPAIPAASSAGGGGELHPLRRLLRFLQPDRSDLIAVVVFAIATGVLLLATPIAVQALVNFVALGGALQPLVAVALLLFLGLALAGVLVGVQTWIVEILQRRIFVRAVADLSARLPRVRLDAYDKSYGPELVNRFLDVITIQKVSANLLLDGLQVVLSIFVGLAVLAFYHPILLAFDALLLIAILLIVLGPLQRGIRTAAKESKAKYAMVGWLEELARNPLLFKSGGAQAWAFERSDLLAGNYVRARQGHFRIVFGQVVSALVLQVVASTALLTIGGLLVMQGSLTLGQLVAAELIVTVVVNAVAKMGKHVESFYDLMAAVGKVGVLLDLPIESRGEEHYRPAEDARGAHLRMSDVSCARPAGGPLLKSIDLDVPGGSSLGITGPTGSGKSTLIQLLWRLREPSSGAIQLDGRDLRVLNVETLRHLVSVASPREVVEGTVEENVRLHRSFITDDDVRRALKDVALDDAVSRLSNEMATPLKQDGHPLSAGEALRLLLARAIVGRPRVLIVDGLLDGLSDEKREHLTGVLFAKDAPWTLVIASNVPEVLERCDQVLELGEGSERSAA